MSAANAPRACCTVPAKHSYISELQGAERYMIVGCIFPGKEGTHLSAIWCACRSLQLRKAAVACGPPPRLCGMHYVLTGETGSRLAAVCPSVCACAGIGMAGRHVSLPLLALLRLRCVGASGVQLPPCIVSRPIGRTGSLPSTAATSATER